MAATIQVQFSDSGETEIISYFSCSQSTTDYPNQGVVESTDSRWATFYAALPKSMQDGVPAPGD